MRIACPGLRSFFEDPTRDQNYSVITPSPLLAAAASAEFAARQLAQGLASWRRPQINSIDAWLVRQWNEARYKSAAVAALLSPAQELLLWKNIIQARNPELFDVPAAARLAVNAHRLMAEWHIPADAEAWLEHADALQFQYWREQFRQHCREQHWLARADLWRFVPRWISGNLCTPGFVVFAGSFKSSPALKNLQATLGSSAKVEPSVSLPLPSSTPCHEFANISEETEQAARWARGILETHNPPPSIGIFIPDLGSRRSLVEHSFRKVFYPAEAHRFVRGNRSRFAASDSAFHLTSAAPLRDEPIVAGALLLLELARPRIGHAQAGAILRSPFLTGATDERDKRALADLRLRLKRSLDFSLPAVASTAAECPKLSKVFSAVARILRERGPGDENTCLELPAWSQFIGDLLGATGWPGDQDLTATEQEAVEGWNNTLSELASLGLVSPALNFNSALALLRRLLTRAGTEIGDWLAPVQILDASEAPDLSFDSTCLSGMSEETWPPPLSASPLVPLKLQRAAGVWNSTPKGIAAERSHLTEALFRVAPQAIATFSGRLAPIARQFVRHSLLGETWSGKLPWQSYAPADLDALVDTQAPPYAANGETKGGTRVIQAQSLCPFKAFAEFRLEARAPEDACFGFDARDRGNFAHLALKLVWQRLETSTRLRNFPAGDLRDLVRDAVAEAVKRPDVNPLGQLASVAERERLEKLVLDWLALEKTRKQSFEVEKVEEARVFSLGGLKISLRFDRIDRLPNDQRLLIDYKSGEQSITKLEKDRPAEPQLLVYAAEVGAGKVDGIFFGQIAPRAVKAVGWSRAEHFADKRCAKIHPDWGNFITESVQKVENLAREFVAGVAAVDPTKGACDYCQLKPFCRIAELKTNQDGADGGE